MNCKNCGQLNQGSYCSHCGQKATVGKITLASLLDELSTTLFQVDRGFFFTMKELFWRPGTTLNDYLIGKRKQHFKPITYLLTLSTIYFLISSASGQATWMDDLITGFSTGASENDQADKIPGIIIWFAKNYAYTTLLLLPVFSLASYLSFRGWGKTFLEHFVINSYITGQQAIFYTLFALLNKLKPSTTLELLPLLVAVSYTCWVFWQIFNPRKPLVISAKILLTYVTYLVFCTVLLLGVLGTIKWMT